MSETRLPPTLSPAEARQIVQTCDRFEAAWKVGPPRPEDFLNTIADTIRPALLQQLLILDWDYRQRTGDDPCVADYQARFPNDHALIEDISREMSNAADSTFVGANESAISTSAELGAREAALTGANNGDSRYQLLNEVGQGGIGVVYRGRDTHLGRELAVKVLRETYRDDANARQRLIEEARIGSQLQHPAIVPVYEQGRLADGRPYFAMKLVEGHTLAELLHNRVDPRRDLPRFLGAFHQVCQAMAYTHSRGIVHRDLKPANIMVGAFGEVQVMDWGFAKVLDQRDDAPIHRRSPERDDRSHTGTLMGTPAYMPPEQARGEIALIDLRTDVFALGAMVCEILTGRPPYAEGSADQILRQAAAGDLAGAHTRLDQCGADEELRSLAKQCLVADRGARPADAGILAGDLSNYLTSAQERLRQAQLTSAAAEARAEEAQARARAEHRSRRLVLALAAALLLGSALAGWQALLATRAEHDALGAAAAQREAKETADVKEAETRAVLDFVQNRIFAAARPEGLQGGLGYDVTMQRALKAALSAVDESFANQPLVEARVRRTLGASFLLLGDADLAAEQFQRARKIHISLLGPDDAETLKTSNDLASSFRALGRLPEALQLFEETLAARTAKFGPEHKATVQTLQDLATVYADQGRFLRGLELREKILAIRKAQLGLNHLETLSAMRDLASSYSEVNRTKDALALDVEAVERLTANFGADHSETLGCRNNLALDYAMVHRFDDALKLQKETLELYKAKFSPTHPTTLVAMHNVAKAHADLKHFGDAVKVLEETLSLQKAKLPPGHPNTIQTMYSLANNYGDQNRFTEALKLHQETLELRKEKLGLNHRSTLFSMWGVVANLIKLDRGAEAVPLIDECLRRAADDVVDPRFSGLADKRLELFVKAKDPNGCRTTAELWEKLKCTDAASLYNSARYRAVTAATIRASGMSADANREADAEADRAIAWLKHSVAAGFKDVAKLAKDADLDALRPRADFQSLLAEVKSAQ